MPEGIYAQGHMAKRITRRCMLEGTHQRPGHLTVAILSGTLGLVSKEKSHFGES